MANATGRRGLMRMVLVAVVLAMSVGCGADEERVDEETPVVAEIDTFAMDHYNGSEIRWTMTGDRAEVQKAGDALYVDNPRVLLYDTGAPSLTITGTSGTIDKLNHDLTIEGSARAVAPDGVLLTEKLSWKDADGTLSSDTDVELRRRDSVIYGSAMTGQPDLRRLRFVDVTFRLNPEDETIEPYPLDMPQAGANAR